MDSLRLILSNRKYFAPAWVFASLNIMVGTWVLYLPHVKSKFALNDAELGFALFFIAFGLLSSIPFIPYINKKIGIGNSTKIGILCFAVAYNLPLLAPSYITLCISLYLVGLLSGYTDVSMNALVSTIEKNEDAHFMSAAHGFFSLGGFIGAGIGSLLLVYLDAPVWHMASVSLIIVLTNLYLSNQYTFIHEVEMPKQENKERLKNIRPLLGLALVSFIILFNEGAVEHWSNLFLFEIVQVSQSQAGLGFIAFSLCMTVGRFLGDGVSQKFGTIKIIAGGCLIAFVAYFLIISAQLVSTVAGFGLLGIGLSVIVPELFRLAGQTKGVPASVGISIVSGVGYAGFLSGPVLLGFISSQSNLTGSFIFLAITVGLAILVTAVQLRKVYS